MLLIYHKILDMSGSMRKEIFYQNDSTQKGRVVILIEHCPPYRTAIIYIV